MSWFEKIVESKKKRIYLEQFYCLTYCCFSFIKSTNEDYSPGLIDVPFSIKYYTNRKGTYYKPENIVISLAIDLHAR